MFADFSEFDGAIAAALTKAGHRTWTSNELRSSWEAFASFVDGGHEEPDCECHGGLEVRDLIEIVLADDAVRASWDFVWFKREIDEADAIVRTALPDQRASWRG